MAGSKFEPDLFFQRADNVALHVPAEELFGFLKRTLDLPVQWAALGHRKTGDHVVVRAGGIVEGDDLEDVMFVRVTPVEVTCQEEGVMTQDRFQCGADVRLRIGVIPERSELISFQQKVLGSHRVAQAAGIARYLLPAVRAGLAKFAAERDANDVVSAEHAGAASAALTDALQAPCFAAGIVLDGAPSVRFESGTLREVQQAQQHAARERAQHQAARQLQEATEKAQAQHLDHLSSLLTRLTQLATASPDVELPELIRTFQERERGELYGALFALEPVTQRTHWIVVAAGDELLYFDTEILSEPTRRLRVDGAAGSVRSIQAARDAKGNSILLLGAATGVYRWPIDGTAPDLTLSVENPASVQGGFNAAVMVSDRVFASHSELGLLQWKLSEPASARPRLASMTGKARAVRGVCFHNGDVYCSIDDRVVRWPADEDADTPKRIYTGSMSTITALCPTADGLLAGNGDGDVLMWSDGHETSPERLHTGMSRAAESVWLLSTSGVRRMIYTDTSLHVHARVLGDSFSCRYEAGGQTLRRVDVAPDMLVATNDLRDRLICWKPGEPANPIATIGVSRLTGRSVQDVCLVV